MAKKTEVPGIYKIADGILINKDNDALKAYKRKKEQSNKLDTLEKEFVELKNDMKEIKDLLRSLIK